MAPIKISLVWNLGTGYLTRRLEELLILNRPCRPGEDVHDSNDYLAYILLASVEEGTYLKRDGSQATKAGVIWFVAEEAVEQRIWEIISRDEIAMNKKPENTITSKKAELRKDEEEMTHHHKHQW